MFANTMRPRNVGARVGSSRSGPSARATVIVPPALAGPLFAVLPPPVVVLLPPHAAAMSAAANAARAQLQIRRMLTPPTERDACPRWSPTRSEPEFHTDGGGADRPCRPVVRRAAFGAWPWQCSGRAQRPPLPPDPGADE